MVPQSGHDFIKLDQWFFNQCAVRKNTHYLTNWSGELTSFPLDCQIKKCQQPTQQYMWIKQDYTYFLVRLPKIYFLVCHRFSVVKFVCHKMRKIKNRWARRFQLEASSCTFWAPSWYVQALPPPEVFLEETPGSPNPEHLTGPREGGAENKTTVSTLRKEKSFCMFFA